MDNLRGGGCHLIFAVLQQLLITVVLEDKVLSFVVQEIL